MSQDTITQTDRNRETESSEDPGKDAFISYAREESDFVRRLVEGLQRRGRSTWVDWSGIPPSAEFMDEIRDAIIKSEAFIFVISPDSVDSRVCHQEVKTAEESEKRLIPLLYAEAEMSKIPPVLRGINWLMFGEEADFEDALDRLVQTLDLDLDWVHAHTNFLIKAGQWEQRGRENALLLRGKELRRAEQWSLNAQGKNPRPSALQIEYITQSRKAERKFQNRVLFSVVGFLIISMALTVYALIERSLKERQRQVAVARQLAAEASLVMNQRGKGLVVAGLLATESLDRMEQLGERSLDSSRVLNEILELIPEHVFTKAAPRTVRDVCLTADDKLLVTFSSEAAELWETSTGELKSRLEFPSGLRLDDCEVSSNGQFLLSAEMDYSSDHRQFFCWNTQNGELIVSGKPEQRISHIAISPDGQYFAIGLEKHVLVYSTPDGAQIRTLPIHGDLASLRFNAQSLLVDSGVNPRLRRESVPYELVREVWLLEEIDNEGVRLESPRWTYRVALEDNGRDRSFRFSPNLESVVTSNRSLSLPTTSSIQLRLGSLKKPKDAHDEIIDDNSLHHETIDVPYSETAVITLPRGVNSIAFSPDGRLLAAAGVDYSAHVFSTSSGELVYRIDRSGPVRAVSFGSGKQFFATCSLRDGPSLWRFTNDRIIRRAPSSDLVVWGLRFSKDGRLLAAATSLELEIWDTQTNELLARGCHTPFRVISGTPIFHPSYAAPVFIDDNTKVLAAGREGVTRIDLETRKSTLIAPPATLSRGFGKDAVKVTTCLSRLGRLVVYADKGSVWVQDTSSGALILKFKQQNVRGTAFGPSEKYLVVGGRDGPVLWDIEQKKEIPVRGPTQSVNSIAFSPSGDTFAACDSKGAVIFRIQNGTATGTRINGDKTTAVGFSPDQRLLAMVESDQIRLWNLQQNEEYFHISVEERFTLGFSSDGSYFAISERNEPTRVWDLKGDGAPYEIMRIAHAENVFSIAFNSDETVLASATTRDIIKLTRFRPADLLEKARTRLPRNLTKREWEDYLGTEPYHRTIPSLGIPGESSD